jgi:hypothetical protein
VALLVDAEQLAELPVRDRRARARSSSARGPPAALDPRDGPVGFGKIGGGAARGDRGPGSQTIAAAKGIGAQHAHQVDAFLRAALRPS